MIKNGAWVFPDAELFSFLKSSQEQKRFPIVIAKKISGILFPVFKGLSIMGLNTYKIFLPGKSKEIIDAVKSDEELLSELKYNNQFQFNECEPIQSFFRGNSRRTHRYLFQKFCAIKNKDCGQFYRNHHTIQEKQGNAGAY